jgi:homopolymeric O-antigen transport system permease protein
MATAGTLERVDSPISTRRIQPSTGFLGIDLRELWRYRELLYRMLWRDIKGRYKQTFLGPIWVILKPLVSMILMAAVFGGLAGFKSGTNTPYPLFLFAGMLIWNYFSSAFGGAAGSILSNAGLMTKVYFPRLYAPLATVVAPLVDLALAMTITFGLFGWFGTWPNWHIVFLPVFVLLALVVGMGIGIWMAGAMVRFRDIGFMLPYAVQLAMYASPVLYPVSRLPKPYSDLIALNPMTSVLDGFRWALIGAPAPNVGVLAVSAAIGIIILAGGLFNFRRVERTIVDHV